MRCSCGKELTETNVCPLPRGQACTGQHVPPLKLRGEPEQQETAAPEKDEIEW